MLDSDFWKDLEKQFRSIEDCARVHFNWTDVAGSPNLELWEFAYAGTILHTPRLRFETLARRAGAKIDPLCLDSLLAWLSRLKREGRQDLVRPGKEPGRGQMQCVCAISADYCLALEARALEAERLARVEESIRNDPRNWSPLRQEWEAHKVAREQFTKPFEEIPEQFIREVLARQYGVKPEEVTQSQIQFEVSGLLAQYPGIHVLPMQPQRMIDVEQQYAAGSREKQDTQFGKASCKAVRTAQVDAFIGECNKRSTARIYKRHIWRSAGHTNARQFEYWQDCNEKKATAEDRRNFTRILSYSPQEFIALLKRQKLIPEA